MSPDEADSQETHEPDPPSLGPEVPSVDVPEVEIPGAGAGDATGADAAGDEFSADADSETVQLFWRLVVVIDVGFAALALGPMFVYFEGDWRRGLLLVVFGLAVLAYGVVQYRRHQMNESSGSDGDSPVNSPQSDAERIAEASDADQPDDATEADPKP